MVLVVVVVSTSALSEWLKTAILSDRFILESIRMANLTNHTGVEFFKFQAA